MREMQKTQGVQNWMRVCNRFQKCFHLCVHKSVPCWPSSAFVIVSLASSTKKEGTIFQVSMVSFRTLTFTDLCPILSITKPWTFVDPVQTNVVILSDSSILYLYYRLSHKLYTFLVSWFLYPESLITSLGCSTIGLVWSIRQSKQVYAFFFKSCQ